MLFAFKVIVAAGMIAYASGLSGRRPVLAGFIMALPLSSFISIVFAYLEHRDMQKLNAYAVSILVAVPLSLVFFLPFVLNKWLKMSFPVTLFSAVGLIVVAYFAHSMFFKSA